MNVAQLFAHHAHVFECCDIQCQSRFDITHLPFVILHAASCGCPPKTTILALFPFCSQPGVLEAALPMCCPAHVDDRTYWLGVAFPFRDLKQVPRAFSRDPPEDDRYLVYCATCGRSCVSNIPRSISRPCARRACLASRSIC